MVEVESAGALAENARRAVDRRLLSLGGMVVETITPARPAAGGERGASGMMSPYVPHVPYIESPSSEATSFAPSPGMPASTEELTRSPSGLNEHRLEAGEGNDDDEDALCAQRLLDLESCI